MLLIPNLKRQRQADLCEFEVGLVLRSFRTARATQRNMSQQMNNNRERKMEREKGRRLVVGQPINSVRNKNISAGLR